MSERTPRPGTAVVFDPTVSPLGPPLRWSRQMAALPPPDPSLPEHIQRAMFVESHGGPMSVAERDFETWWAAHTDPFLPCECSIKIELDPDWAADIDEVQRRADQVAAVAIRRMLPVGWLERGLRAIPGIAEVTVHIGEGPA